MWNLHKDLFRLVRKNCRGKLTKRPMLGAAFRKLLSLYHGQINTHHNHIAILQVSVFIRKMQDRVCRTGLSVLTDNLNGMQMACLCRLQKRIDHTLAACIVKLNGEFIAFSFGNPAIAEFPVIHTRTNAESSCGAS